MVPLAGELQLRSNELVYCRNRTISLFYSKRYDTMQVETERRIAIRLHNTRGLLNP